MSTIAAELSERIGVMTEKRKILSDRVYSYAIKIETLIDKIKDGKAHDGAMGDISEYCVRIKTAVNELS